MKHRIEASRPLRGHAGTLQRRFASDPATWLPVLSEPGMRPGHWQVYLWGGEIGLLVDLVLGKPSHEGAATSRSIRWSAGTWWGGRQVPSFDGHLNLRHDEHGTQLMLSGAYEPPGGLLGLIADRVLLHRLAAATLHQFLADIAERLDPEPRPATGATPTGSRIPPD